MTISLRGVEFRYGRTSVLRGLDWDVRPGITGLIGPNGSGKTTLMSLMVGMAAPRSGSVHVVGHDMTTSRGRTAARRNIGFVPQRFSLVPAMTVQDTVAYAAWANGVADKGCRPAAQDALRLTGLDDLADRRVRTLSGGQRQRIGIAAALAHRPPVLVLDEPTVGLDPGQRLRLREMLRAIAAGRSVVLSTHLIEDVAHVCDTIGVLAGGRIAYSGTFEDLERRTAGVSRPGAGSPFERAYADLIGELERG